MLNVDVEEAAVILAREAGYVTTLGALRMLGLESRKGAARELLAIRRKLIESAFEQRGLPKPAIGEPYHAEPAATH